MNMYRVLNIYIRKFSLILQGSEIRRIAIMEGFWIFQNSEYTRFLRMQALRKVAMQYDWRQGSECAWSMFHRF